MNEHRRYLRPGMRALSFACAVVTAIAGTALHALGASPMSPGSPMIPPPKIVTPNPPAPQLPTIPTPAPSMQPLPRVEGTGGAGGTGGRPPMQATNQPIPGIDIVVLEKPPTSKLTIHTDGNGGFSIPKVTAREVSLEFTADSLRTATGSLGPKQPGGNPQETVKCCEIIVVIALFHTADGAVTKDAGTTKDAGQAFGARRIEHRFSAEAQSKGLHVSVAIAKDGTASTIDWGDGAGAIPVARAGKFAESWPETSTRIDPANGPFIVGTVSTVK